jgi:hypothetical protein
MTGILKVDTIQKNNGETPTTSDLGINISGNIVQVVNHKTTTRLTADAPGTSTITATSGVLYTSFNFTPKFANSKLLLTSTVFNIGERSNSGDAIYASANYDNSVLIGSVLNYTGFGHWTGNLDTSFVSFNHMFNSWGVSQKSINIRAGGTSNPIAFAINYPNAIGDYVNQYNSPNQHEVCFTLMEIAG